MVNSETTLKEFVLCIPTCYEDSNLESLVSTIYKNSLKIIALVDREGKPLGVIRDHCLLGWMTQKLAANRDVLGNLDEDFLQKAVLSLISLPSQMKVEDFLTHFALDKQEQQQNYLIIDEVGKLLGILDIAKLLQTLWRDRVLQAQEKPNVPEKNYAVTWNNCALEKEISSQFDYSKQAKASVKEKVLNSNVKQAATTQLKNQVELRNLNPNFYALLTQISLPLAIENARGKICYQNEHWEREIKPNRALFNKKLMLEPTEAESRLIAAKEQSLSETKSRNDSHHCATASNFSIVPFSLEKLPQQINKLDNKTEKKLLKKTIIEQKITTKPENQGSSHYYYRLPLDISQNHITITDSPNYWLIFATKFPLQQNLTIDSWAQQQFKLKQLQDEFIINISHDIKSPLTAIIGLSSLLKEEKLGNLNNSQVRHAKMIYYSGKRLINLINDFLDITHLTTRKLQFNLESIKIEDTCKRIYHQVTQKIKTVTEIKHNETSLFPELQLDIASDAEIAIADKAYFCQILTRLIENALQLTSAEELLGITAECWSNWLAITVWNEGGGLSEAQQNFLATEFSHGTNFLTSQEKNQGLGLILAQQLAQVHQGDISFISQSNYGSEFTLLLPLKPDNLEPNKNTSEDSPNIETNHTLVLIVETASKQIIDLSGKLTSLGYHCAIARNSAEALYKTRCLKPGKILLNSSFIETAEQSIVAILKSDPITSNIPVLITTNTSWQQNSWDNLADEVLNFPISKATLTQFFPPIVSRQSILAQNLTVLRLSLRETITQPKENLALDFVFENPSFSLSHHIIEADSLEQAHLLAGIWDIDAIIWDGVTLESPETYLQSFAELDVLASIPIITLDAQTTAVANKIPNLAVFPCLLPAQERSIQQLTQVIQIAAGLS